MTIYWSAAQPGFWDTQYIDEAAIPADGVEVLPADHAALMDAQAQGKIIQTNAATGGPEAIDPPPPPNAPADQCARIINQPLTVQCVTVPALDGEYPNNSATRQAMTGVVSQINAGMGLPGGGVTFNWPDAAGSERQWPGPEFIAFANASNHFVYDCQQTIGGFSDVVPSRTLVVDTALVARAEANVARVTL